MEHAATHEGASWLQATALQRVDGLLDPGSFKEYLGPAERVQSPHLALFNLTAATCSRIVISEEGRIGVSGPEVIETNKGVEEFDAANKALVWSVVGGKNRRLIGGADAFARDTMSGFRDAAIAVLGKAPSFDLKTLRAEQGSLAARHRAVGHCDDAIAMWTALGIKDPEAIRDMGDGPFIKIADSVKEANHDAR